MQKITVFLWFDSHAEEAMKFYTTLFNGGKMVSIKRYPGGSLEGPMQGMEGKVLTGIFELAGQQLMALDGGPAFEFTPSVSLFVDCETIEEVERLWGGLSQGGTILMPLQAYPFSEKYGWLKDKYGLSWQLNLGNGPQTITPFLMFVGEQGKAEEAVQFYTSLFKNSRIKHIERYGASDDGPEGMVKRVLFQLAGQEFMAIDGGPEHSFTFNEATSLYVDCDGQEEVDHLWERLSAVPESEQCGWLKDRYGLSWQIVPSAMPDMMDDPDPVRSKQVMDALLQMKKIDLKMLQDVAAAAT